MEREKTKEKKMKMQEIIDKSLPISVDGLEYAEPTIVSEGCPKYPLVMIPIYEIKNYDTGHVLYMTFNNKQIVVSDRNVNGLRCSVCDMCKKDDSDYYVCITGEHEDRQEYLKNQVKTAKLVKTRK